MLDTLTVPQSRPAQWKQTKVIPREAHEAVLAQLGGTYRDIVIVLAGTGWHVTEVHRLAQGGKIEKLRARPWSSTGPTTSWSAHVASRARSSGPP